MKFLDNSLYANPRYANPCAYLIRRIIVQILLPLVLLLLLCAHQAHAKKPEFKSLYQDSTGWFISRAIPGSDVLSSYGFTPERYNAVKSRGLESKCLAQLLYMYEECPAFYYLFFLAVPEGMTIRWNDQSLIRLTYTCGRDTLTVYSSNLFFATDSQPNWLIYTWVGSGVSVPNPGIFSQQTWTDKKTGVEYSLPAIFARFEFRKMPDKLLNCIVSDVLVFRKTERL